MSSFHRIMIIRQCAKLMEYNRKKSMIQTVYLYGYKETEMPLIMGIYSYIDCREGSREKIADCIDKLLKKDKDQN